MIPETGPPFRTPHGHVPRRHGTKRRRQRIGVALVSLGLAIAAAAPAAAGAGHCAAPGHWVVLAEGEPVAWNGPAADLLARMAETGAVFLGEAHDSADHHRWQLQTVAALHASHPRLVLGVEMFPRAKQEVLDRWVAGALSEQAFLKQTAWEEVWGFDAELYMPLFHFARLNRVPMVAMNVDRDLVARVGREGWQAIPVDERQSLGDPLPASVDYRRALAEVFAMKRQAASPEGRASGDFTAPSEEAIAAAEQSPLFARFVDAQLTWDRAMAEAVADTRGREPDRLFVGIVGRGHVEFGWGIPHQLADLGMADSAVLLPLKGPDACAEETAGRADAAFVLADDAVETAAPPPRLGVQLTAADDGARIADVLPGTVAETAGLRTDDVITSVAGSIVNGVGDVISAVRRQPPGTWLPLTVRRNGTTVDVVAQFPPLSRETK